ncbi:glycerophosphodiester phosphodiesterase GDPD1, chloroplastic [Physcomitrium patens]|uniref:glycerophosphodiester phosphodiesterase n=1 Tax=Physcomitrium patens TaxID=3218 RepID=A0A2K1JQY8_PHYPA|nr:glycerophosphodiester phosphodiesterase GDPD1, chloroplastic-like [Physcomitrium patens]PNR43951.1 hypothetical protein PHYPA_016334 [Physcomitrium patens]|eukprot:XP_024390337.1 glycerophosphodiester phosphodiesterase GDPD1, chloroplastic-like [Physcomitrella patens]
MQGEAVHGISLPSCTAVIDIGAVTTRLQRSVSFVELRVGGLASVSSLHASGELVGKGKSDWGNEGRSFSFGSRSSRPAHSMVEIVGEALTEASLPAQACRNQDLALDIGFNGIPEAIASVIFDEKLDETSSSLVIVGHRGCGKNKTLPHGAIPEARLSIRENTIMSFNLAARNGAQFVEFDVQVTKDGVPIIFHDDEIIADSKPPRHIGDISVAEFRAMGPQKGSTMGKPLYRKASDGSTTLWTADVEDQMCTLEDAFAQVNPTVGFNIEMKFDDSGLTSEAELLRVIDAVLADVRQHANGRMIYFSTFHPDAAQMIRKKMPLYPVFFLTDGGSHVYNDPRRNSIQAAIEVCREGNLQGIVSEVKAVLHQPALVALVKASGLFFFTYGELNNVGEAVIKQREWGIDGVIVDHVLEIVRVARQLEEPASSSNAAMARSVVVV